ncbi:MAG: hydroxymethylpyrimidine/phosphomethylpyrimidine kinase [Marinospirillum sp.]|uniref:bifunctional hydroxymethylpyrimidine kinase/phosphomethylpyrimidine kinase n=1 Tax=Marinospirillum sp. TaxID=2183934 RepID=UPI001A0881E2|nr:hydroxymethylpyrimidine/phosphomethylpyrimidine kinase [Marinospirillum sp.]MBE0505681.1 hydroxymethylpyrimidine/phosphomethylpyrimidine kinase [Marinospirillum sp.]
MIKTGSQFQKHYPCVLAIGGHDPSGGAGVIADAQTLLALKTWPLTLITCLTAQNTRELCQINPQEPEAFAAQLAALLKDFRPAAIKLGVTGSLALQEVLAHFLNRYPDIPLILDPVITSSSGTGFADQEQLSHLKSELLPHTTVITPNLPELDLLIPGKASVEQKARALIKQGCKAVLVTGTHAQTRGVKNLLFTASSADPVVSRWERLPHEYHGSGCTLASALAACLARGEPLDKASTLAQDFTWQSLENALKLTEGQHLPLRLQSSTHG